MIGASLQTPYGRITAIDLNVGEILWEASNGEGLRDHLALRDLDLPQLGQPGRAPVLVTPTLLVAGERPNVKLTALTQFWGGPGGKMFRTYDMATRGGAESGRRISFELPPFD